jgi:hypothetical protein
MYALNGNSSDIYDVGPAGMQDQSRADYANSVDDSDGFFYTTRIIDYEGQEQFCTSPKSKNKAPTCANQNVALHTAPGYDNMTGLGSPNSGFVNALAGK